jgi:hypothetical protein
MNVWTFQSILSVCIVPDDREKNNMRVPAKRVRRILHKCINSFTN